MQRERIHILGVGIDSVTMSQAAERVAGFAASGSFHQVVTVNPEFIMTAQRNREFAAVLNAADLAVADGVGLILAARWLGQPLPERVPGVDLVGHVASLAAQRGLSLFLLGAAPGVAEATATILSQRYTGLIIAGAHAGSPQPEDEDAILSRLQAAKPDILMVAYGAPAQDSWIRRHHTRLPAGVAMGIGGAFDFISGHRQRAPRWVQRLGLEWLHRLLHEPWRWRRMLSLPRFALAVLLHPRSVDKSRQL